MRATFESAALKQAPLLRKSRGVFWAETYHLKDDFNMQRDDVTDWREYLFRN